MPDGERERAGQRTHQSFLCFLWMKSKKKKQVSKGTFEAVTRKKGSDEMTLAKVYFVPKDKLLLLKQHSFFLDMVA
jgi:hypothetical protein